MFSGTNAELADRLASEKEEVTKLGFALNLMVDRPEVEQMVSRINSWIDDACERLRCSESP
jgi:hypothetical protein